MTTFRPFQTLHPALACVWFGTVLLLTMSCRQPVLIGISLVASLVTLACVQGQDGLAKISGFGVFALVVGLMNPLFSAAGATELCKIGPIAIYAESLWYGMCSSAMLLASVAWLMCAAASLTSSVLFSLFGGPFALLGLMLRMGARLVPQILARGTRLQQLARIDTNRELAATSAAQARGQSAVFGLRTRVSRVREQVGEAARLSATLLTWSLEDSLIAADAMRSRGWQGAPRRTSYRPYVWSGRDSRYLLLFVLVGGVSCALGAVAASQYVFYPYASELVWWWGYVVYALWFMLAAASCAREMLWWWCA